MSKIHIQGYGSLLEIYYTVINKSDIKSKYDLYDAYLDNLISWNDYKDTYFSTVEYQNDDYDEISVKENLLKSSYEIVPQPTQDTIVIATYTISKKGYLEFDIDDEIDVDVSYSNFIVMWIQDISQNGQSIDTEITDFGRPNEEGVSSFYLNSKGELVERYDGVWLFIDNANDVDKETEETIRSSTDEWYEEIFANSLK